MSKVSNIAMQTARVLVINRIAEISEQKGQTFHGIAERWDVPSVCRILEADGSIKDGRKVIDAAVSNGLLHWGSEIRGRGYYGGRRLGPEPFKAPDKAGVKASTSDTSLAALKAAREQAKALA